MPYAHRKGLGLPPKTPITEELVSSKPDRAPSESLAEAGFSAQEKGDAHQDDDRVKQSAVRNRKTPRIADIYLYGHALLGRHPMSTRHRDRPRVV